MQDLSCDGIWFPYQGWNPGLLPWEQGVLTTGPPGKSQKDLSGSSRRHITSHTLSFPTHGKTEEQGWFCSLYALSFQCKHLYPCDNNNEVFLSQEPDSISRGGLFIPLCTSLLNFVSSSFLPRLKLQLLRKEGKTVWVTGDTALLIKAQLNHGGRLAPLELSPVQSWGLSQLHKCFFSFILASAPSGPQLPGRWGLWGILHQVPWSGSSDSGHLQRCRVTFALLLIMLLFPQVVLRFNWHVTLCKFKVYNKMIWYF